MTMVRRLKRLSMSIAVDFGYRFFITMSHSVAHMRRMCQEGESKFGGFAQRFRRSNLRHNCDNLTARITMKERVRWDYSRSQGWRPMPDRCEDVVEALRQRGERLTIQRRLVIEALCDDPDHQSVQAIQERLRARGMRLTEPTVYRIVQWLKELGLVSQTDLGQSGIVYQLIGDRPHHHLVCLACGRVIDVDDGVMDALRATLRQDYDFEPRIDHMAFFGLCRDCRERSDRG